MPLPAILGVAAAIAGATGIGSAIHGGAKMKKANDTMNEAKMEHQANIAAFEALNEETTSAMDQLGKQELEILKSFEKFASIFERILFADSQIFDANCCLFIYFYLLPLNCGIV